MDEPHAAEAAKSRYESLTDRELEVALSLARGKRNQQIANELGLSVKTVDTHRGHVLKKLGLPDNGALVFDAVEHGLIPVGGEHVPSLIALANAARVLAGSDPDHLGNNLAALQEAVVELDRRKQ